MAEKSEKTFRYYKTFKPFGMLSQFSKEGNHSTLADLDFTFPKDVYPIGRLDSDSEGLLLLTNDPRVNKLLLAPESKKKKVYWTQVEGEMSEDAMNGLRKGVEINLKGTVHRARAASVKGIPSPGIPEREPSVNYKKHSVTSWIEIVLTEGKNRQVRKMTAKVGHPTLRLIRYAIENISIEGMTSGQVSELNHQEFYRKLNLK